MFRFDSLYGTDVPLEALLFLMAEGCLFVEVRSLFYFTRAPISIDIPTNCGV